MCKIYQKSHLSFFKAGFTLIELLVVVLIIGILAVIALPQYQYAVAKAKYMEMYALAANVRRAQQAYYMANGVYAQDLFSLDIEFPSSFTASSQYTTTYGKVYGVRNAAKKILCTMSTIVRYDIKDWSPSSMVCWLEKDGIWHNIAFSTGAQQCRATRTNSFAMDFCRRITGQKDASGTWGGTDVFPFRS